MPADAVDEALQTLGAELQAAHKENARLRTALALQEAGDLARGATRIGDVAVVAAEVANADAQTLRDMSDRLREMLGSAVVVLATVVDGKPQMIAAVTDDLVQRGLHAGALVKAIAKIVGGGGGGKAALAQAGGRDPERLPEALAAVPDLVPRAIGRLVTTQAIRADSARYAGWGALQAESGQWRACASRRPILAVNLSAVDLRILRREAAAMGVSVALLTSSVHLRRLAAAGGHQLLSLPRVGREGAVAAGRARILRRVRPPIGICPAGHPLWPGALRQAFSQRLSPVFVPSFFCAAAQFVVGHSGTWRFS